MRSVEFHPDAQNEFISAFYERQTEGLGLDFIAIVMHPSPAATLARIRSPRRSTCALEGQGCGAAWELTPMSGGQQVAWAVFQRQGS